MKKGISLVALIITIIVLIILTAAVVLTGANTPQEAQLAVFYNNITTVQEAVRLQMNSNLTKYVSRETTNLMKYKWVGVVDGYTEENAREGISPVFNDKVIQGNNVEKIDANIKKNITMSEEEFNKYYVDNNGVVYYEGFIYNGVEYYNRTITSAATVVPEDKLLTSIIVTTAPTKVNYVEGEEFDSTGMVVTATYSDSTTSDVSGYTITPSGELGLTDESIIVSYTENGVTKTVTQAITIVLNPVTDGSYCEAKGVNSPKLDTGMTAVYWDNGGNEIKQYIGGELNPAFEYNDWYDYIGSTQEYDTDYTASKWANAVTEDGSYWVWIPRYAYSIVSGYHAETRETNNAGKIEIEFLKGKTNETTSGRTSFDNELGQEKWNIHPAFRYNDGTEKILSGIWVAKYEMSNNGTKAVSVPGVNSWVNILIEACFTNSLNINPGLQSHLMRNSEWGAVAYLAQSKYGRNGKEVEITDKDYITGERVEESTTGNMYGIFDMNGGAWEYVAAGISANVENKFGIENAKYYEVYEASAYGDRYGDAIYEISISISDNSSWYGDAAIFVRGGSPFFIRGGYYNNGSNAGLFFFRDAVGGARGSGSFRSVLWGEI